MVRKILGLVGVFLLGCAQGLAQNTEPAPQAAAAPQVPAASASDIECSGFISGNAVPEETWVFDGADNDYRSHYRQYKAGDYVFLRGGGKEAAAVGTEYRLVRPATAWRSRWLFAGDLEPLRAFGQASWYPAQDWSIRSLGHAYEDVGRVKVVALASQGSTAEVTFACGTIAPGDLAIPYLARPIPTYTQGIQAERFAPLGEGKLGAITAANSNAGALATGSIGFLNLGETDGVHVGQRYRVFHIDRDLVEGWWKAAADTPAETVGEMVVLFTEEKSSVAIVIYSLREIDLGDGVVPE